ncbi:MAG: methyltransferase domain-containing protein [Rhodospirillum sp.]|nr:methyltransferase domain-containing protein [Rhodospirillum sp.]MCF8488146.1 methyltransferase domain-containing protein [Rhodospirillum sp.]MCF8502263.1 methyltransferase domain-containing protein [Rhodospirillum sp.]
MTQDISLGSAKDFSRTSRWENYTRANNDFPDARKAELSRMLSLAAPKSGETALDFGCGDGLLTLALADSLAPGGKVMAMDASAGMLQGLAERIDGRSITMTHLTGPTLPLADNSVDLVTSLANYHHIPDKITQAREFARVLRPGGRLIIGDVADGTNIQRYFDGTVHEVSSTGHQHRFLDRCDCDTLCQESDLTLTSWEIHPTPWIFEGAEQAANFLHRIHDATCTPEECLNRAHLELGTHEREGRFLIFWKLFFLVAHKPFP